MTGLLGAALLAGLATALTWCLLPVTIASVAWVIAASRQDRGDHRLAGARLWWCALALAAGFASLVSGLGTSTSAWGRLLHAWLPALAAAGGAAVAASGGGFFFVHRLPRAVDRTWVAALLSLIVGSALALGWTPCPDPFVAHLLTLGAARATAAPAAGAWTAFGLGVGCAVGGMAFAIDALVRRAGARADPIVVRRACGIALAIAGILVAARALNPYVAIGLAR